MSDLAELQDAIRDFADRRDWQQFHTPKNLAMALCGEAGELAAELQWLTPEQSESLDAEALDRLRFEAADVAIYLLRLCDVTGIDLATSILQKLDLNESRFPLSASDDSPLDDPSSFEGPVGPGFGEGSSPVDLQEHPAAQ